jgi:hypothetical protein
MADPRLTIHQVTPGGERDAAPAQPRFYYDLADVECYLVGERVNGLLAVVPEWVPVWFGADRPRPDQADVEARAMASSPPTPAGGELAAKVATYARELGRAVAFSLAAFRQAYAGGRDLDDIDTLLIAAAACELHPRAILKGLERPKVAETLRANTAEARERGVHTTPALLIGDRVLSGPRCVEDAAGVLGASDQAG